MDVGCAAKFSDDMLETYVLGQLSDPASARLEEHLLVCHTCQDRMEAIDEFIRVAWAATAVLLSESPRQKSSQARPLQGELFCIAKPHRAA